LPDTGNVSRHVNRATRHGPEIDTESGHPSLVSFAGCGEEFDWVWLAGFGRTRANRFGWPTKSPFDSFQVELPV